MKKILLGAFILIAGLGQSYAKELTAMDYCNQIFKTAKATMSARQEGVELIELAPNTKSDLGQEMLISAYSSPQYFTDEYKNRSKTEFANKYYLDCLVNYR